MDKQMLVVRYSAVVAVLGALVGVFFGAGFDSIIITLLGLGFWVLGLVVILSLAIYNYLTS
jgi:hypothetical protein